MSADREQSFRVIENEWILLRDGTRLAARIWMPSAAAESPVPAILEYLPYRKRDGTCIRDESTYPVFAAAGYAGVRVDMRGAGDSEGLMFDEYTPQELADAIEVIEWIAAQPWCTGRVGMMGISWGGFNSLQVASLQPDALKAIISIASTVDRYNDDIHYKGGALLSANLSWSSYMLCYSSRPPDPAIVGAGWRDQWLERLRNEPLLISTWLRHQAHDDYWRHGSICGDYGAVQTPTLIIAGWGDGYKNAPPAAAANLRVPVKAINGPWIHKYPHFAWPKPRADFHGEALRWWDRWLKDIPNGAEDLPAYRAFVTENIRPSHWRAVDPGRWVAEAVWPSRSITLSQWKLSSDGRLTKDSAVAGVRHICSPQDCGVASGEFFTLAPNGDLPTDQRIDDAGSLCFETEPLAEPLEILGRPRLVVNAAINAPTGNLIVRLLDIHPDGVSQRVSFGVLNLGLALDQTAPSAIPVGARRSLEITLDECGHQFSAGHRLRLAISTAYWPLVLPPPTAVTATIETGTRSVLELPARTGGDHYDVPEPANRDPLPKYRQVTQDFSRRWYERDLNAGLTRYNVLVDTGEVEIAAADGLIARELREETYTIDPSDPLSAVCWCRWLMTRRRGDWAVRTESSTTLTADARGFHLAATLKAYEGTSLAIERSWEDLIPRMTI
jgi:uncharacterized protein